MPGSSLSRHLENGVDPGNEVETTENRTERGLKFESVMIYVKAKFRLPLIGAWGNTRRFEPGTF